MTYIINPFYFYLSDLCGAINIACLLCGFFSMLAGSIFLLAFTDEDEKTIQKNGMKAIIIGAFIIVIGIITPSKETVERMIIAKYVTYENYEKGKEEVKEIVDYIFEKFEEEDLK